MLWIFQKSYTFHHFCSLVRQELVLDLKKAKASSGAAGFKGKQIADVVKCVAKVVKVRQMEISEQSVCTKNTSFSLSCVQHGEVSCWKNINIKSMWIARIELVSRWSGPVARLPSLFVLWSWAGNLILRAPLSSPPPWIIYGYRKL